MISLGPHPTAVAPPLQPTAPSPKADNENSSFAACQKLLSTPQAPTSKPNPISPASPSRSSLASARPQLPLVRRSITNQREGVQPTRSLAVPPSAVLAIPPKPPRLHAPETQLPATSARARSFTNCTRRRRASQLLTNFRRNVQVSKQARKNFYRVNQNQIVQR